MAGLEAPSYTAPVPTRQTRHPQSRSAIAALLLASVPLLGGCSTIMMPLSGWTSSQATPPAGELTTASIPKPTVPAPPAESDGDVIRRTVEAAAKAKSTPQLAWANPASGNSGTITGLNAATAKNGAPCRDFSTTLATIEGVSMYRGRACQGYAGPWDLVDFTPAAPPAP